MPSEINTPPFRLGESHSTNGLARETAWPHHMLLLLFTWIWGANFVLAEVALADMTPIAFSVSRFVMGGLGLLAILVLPMRSLRAATRPDLREVPMSRGDAGRLLLVAVLGATLAPWLGIEGLARTYAGRAALWLALAPAFSALIGHVVRTERISRGGRLGLGLAAIGTIGMAADGLAPGREYWLGDLLLIGGMTLAVTELHLIRPLAWRYGAVRVVALRTSIGALIYVLIASPALVRQEWLTFSPWTWVAILAGGLIGVGIGHWVKVRALRAVGPTQVVIYGNLVPLATLLIAWATIGTPSSALEIVAGVLIVAGAICTQAGASPIIENRLQQMNVSVATPEMAPVGPTVSKSSTNPGSPL